MNESSYPIFMPPGDLASRHPKLWSKQDADAYFDWFLHVSHSRVENLLKYLGLSRNGESEALLHTAQIALEDKILNPRFSQFSPSAKYNKLTNEGYALAADMGLLVADCLLVDAEGAISWKILKKPKRDLSYNLPVLLGCTFWYYDPVAVSVGDLAWIVRGNQKDKAWVGAYKRWQKDLLSTKPDQ